MDVPRPNDRPPADHRTGVCRRANQSSTPTFPTRASSLALPARGHIDPPTAPMASDAGPAADLASGLNDITATRCSARCRCAPAHSNRRCASPNTLPAARHHHRGTEIRSRCARQGLDRAGIRNHKRGGRPTLTPRRPKCRAAWPRGPPNPVQPRRVGGSHHRGENRAQRLCEDPVLGTVCRSKQRGRARRRRRPRRLLRAEDMPTRTQGRPPI